MELKTVAINPFEDNRWDDFITKHPQGLVYHHSMWGKVIKSTYNYQPLYVGLEQSDTGLLEGVVPFFLIDSMFTGKDLFHFLLRHILIRLCRKPNSGKLYPLLWSIFRMSIISN